MNRDDLVERLHQSVSDKDLRIWRLVVEAANTITALHAEVAALRAQAGNNTELEQLREWKAAILEKCKASNGFDSLKWAGDKEGWGFIHYFIGHLETRALHAETVLEEQDRHSPPMNAAEAIQEMVGLIDPHADELDDREVNKVFDVARRLWAAGYRKASLSREEHEPVRDACCETGVLPSTESRDG